MTHASFGQRFWDPPIYGLTKCVINPSLPEVQEQNRVKHFARRRIPAAVLIQSAWRCYAVGSDTNYSASWKAALRNVPQPNGTRLNKGSDGGRESSIASAMAQTNTVNKRENTDTQSVLSLSMGRLGFKVLGCNSLSFDRVSNLESDRLIFPNPFSHHEIRTLRQMEVHRRESLRRIFRPNIPKTKNEANL